MARIPENIIELIKQRSDIVDVVSQYVNLTKKSAQNLFGLCPFHQEKTPSFSVSPQKQIYYCFGCQKGGDAIHFIMDVEHMSYPEAIRFLGERAGVDIPEPEDSNERYQEAKQKRERLYQLNTEAARYYYKQLISPAGSQAREYIQRRKISKTTATSFGLGYATEDWQGLLNHLRNKGFTEPEIVDSGLFKQNRKGGWYDLFRNRIMFPIIDVMGKIVAFGGRVMDDSLPKYINSPENSVYTKGQHLYGLNLAKKTKADRLIVVEGYLDCISLHQAGFDQAVASLGTALTAQQAALLRKYKEEILLAYDMDTAGRLATLRNIDVLEEKGAKPYVLQLPDAKDPDAYLSKHSAADFDLLIKDSLDGLDYKFYYAKLASTHNNSFDRVQYQERAADLLLEIKNPVIQELYIPRVAEDLGVPQDSVKLLVRMRKEDQNAGRKTNKYYQPTPVHQDNSEPAYRNQTQDNRKSDKVFSSAEANLLMGIIRRPDIYNELNQPIQSKWFHSPASRPLVDQVLVKAKENDLNDNKFMNLVNEQEEELREKIASEMGQLLIKDSIPLTYEETLHTMKRQIYLILLEYYSAIIARVTRQMDTGQAEKMAELKQKYQDVSKLKSSVEEKLRSLENLFQSDEDNN